VKDPWRVVDPLRPQAPEKSERIDLDQRDVDWDMRPSLSCVLRFKACSIELSSRDLQSPRDALEMLAKLVLELKKAKAPLPGIRAKWGRVMTDVPPANIVCARLECDDVCLWFENVTLDIGALTLTRALIKFGRDAKLSPILRRHGVTPMLKA